MNLEQVSFKSVSKKLAVLFLPLVLLIGEVNSAVNIESSVTGLEVSEETIKAGMQLFDTKCASCHALDRRMTGPALKGVTEKRELEWLVRWIRNNNELRESGDADAIAIYNEFNGIPMNQNLDLSDDQIKSILMYIENGGWSDAPAVQETATDATVQETDTKTVRNINWVLILIALLVGVIIIMATKILDLVSKITGRQVIKWNNVNATLMLLFLVAGMTGVIYETIIHGKYVLIGNAASEHGVELDRMMMITLIITAFVFFVTQTLLFWFSFKYREKKGVKAVFYPENDKLEIIWTIIPTIVLTVLVIGGLNAWNKLMDEPDPQAMEIEVFGFQFGWQARYPGADGELGNANYNLISGTNPLGLANKDQANTLISELEKDIVKYQADLDTIDFKLAKLKLTVGGLTGKDRAVYDKQITDIESGKAASELEDQIRRRNTQINRIKQSLDAGDFFTSSSNDDIIVSEIHLVVNQPVTMRLRGRDVIHSAYLKEFRAQMNVVPGVPTHFQFIPTITTQQQREETGNKEFDYYLICNKICGNSHFNMKIKVIVETQEEYEAWMRTQNAFFTDNTSGTDAEPETGNEVETDSASTDETQDLAINN